MNNVYKLVTGRDFNAATLSGAIDIVCVKHKDGSLHCTPFHVRFGKLILVHATDKQVQLRVNGVPVDLIMKLGAAGEAFFVQESDVRTGSCWSPARSVLVLLLVLVLVVDDGHSNLLFVIHSPE